MRFHCAHIGPLQSAGQVALLTGAGRGSICIELGKALLQGGATVVVTTWNRTDQMLQYDLGAACMQAATRQPCPLPSLPLPSLPLPSLPLPCLPLPSLPFPCLPFP
eukprot:SAG22_NODE_14482_length_373_cov_1.302920_1_plen_105_part_01